MLPLQLRIRLLRVGHDRSRALRNGFLYISIPIRRTAAHRYKRRARAYASRVILDRSDIRVGVRALHHRNIFQRVNPLHEFDSMSDYRAKRTTTSVPGGTIVPATG